MTFSALCTSDPLLGFIRQTYGAIPLRIPDERCRPLALFTIRKGRVQHLGNAEELADAGAIPPTAEAVVPEVSHTRSSEVTWDGAVKVLGPFLTAMLGIGLPDLQASVGVRTTRRTGVTLSIGRTTRLSSSVIAIGRWLEGARPRIPSTISLDGPVYLVDSVFRSKEVSLSVSGESARELTMELSAGLEASVAPHAIVRSDTRVRIRGERPVAFGITCVEVSLDANGALSGIRQPAALPSVGAADVVRTSTETS